MAKATTEKLFVNLSASQARKRLKNFGHGVKKVESIGRHQAVIVHTATGQHLHELQALLADVTTSTSASSLDIPIETLRNVGRASAVWLREIGVDTRKDLEKLGPTLAYRLVKQRRPDTSLNLLWALAAALTDRDWQELSASEKQALKAQVDEDG